ncbi:MAG: hypothetical protein RLZZ84_1752 [Pseudomonadota bacterium]|jgi:Flp pilus assembly protein TadG
MKWPAIRSLHGIGNDTAGTSVIETAVLLPAFLLLFAGLFDFGAGFSEKLKTQQAAVRGVELATTAGLEGVTAATIQAEAAAAANVPAAQVTVDMWTECNGTRLTDPNGVCATNVQTARWISVHITNSYHPILGSLLPASIASDGVIHYVGEAVVRQQ